MHLLPNNHKKNYIEITTFALQSLTKQSEQLPTPKASWADPAVAGQVQSILLWQGRLATSPGHPEQILLWQGRFAASPEPASHSTAPVQL